MATRTICDKCGEETKDEVAVLIEDEDSERQWDLCDSCERLLVEWLMQKTWAETTKE